MSINVDEAQVIQNDSLGEIVNGVRNIHLKNGLRVILEENHSAPVVAVNVWVKTGSSCEQEVEYGLAHVHEHMVFKGTTRRDVGEIARVIEGDGGDINAFTSFDETVYFVVIASRFLPTALDVLSDAMENSTFDPDELTKELEVVMEEIRRSEDSPARVLSEKVFSTAYSVHPYKRPVIGTKESVNSFTRERVINFYDKWYSPSNMVLVLVGDFNTNDAIRQIENTFGKIKPRVVPECVIPKEPEQKEIRTFVIDKNVQEGYFSLAFHIPNARHEDSAVLDVISNILGGGESSRLYRRVKEENGLVTNVYAYSFTPKHSGLFGIGGTVDPEKSKEALSEIVKETYRLKFEPASLEELSRAKINIESNSIYTKETMQGQAQKRGYFEVHAGDYKFEEEYLGRISQVSQEDIIRVAKKYLNNQNLNAGILFPTGKVTLNEREIEEIADEASVAIEQELSPMTSNSSDKVSKVVLDNGITVLVKENHSVPLFAARAVFLGGVRYEDENTNGVSNFVSETLTRGTQSRSAEDIARGIESIAGEVSGFSGRNSFGVTVEALSRYSVQAMDIFADVTLNPSFNPVEIERARRDILSRINREGDDLVRTTINQFLSTLYKVHPYRFNVLGTSETVNRINREDLVSFYEKYARPENMVIAIVGDVNEKEVLKEVEKRFGEMKKVQLLTPDIKPEAPPLDIRTKIVDQKDKAQTHMIMGFHAPSLKDPDQYPFEVLNAVLSGQGGRLFTELRDKRSLAYTVTSFLTAGIEPGFFGVYIGSAPEKRDDAIAGIKEQLGLVLKEGITEGELNRAQNYLVGNFEIGLQQNSSQAAKMAFDEIYGIGWDEYKKYPDQIFSVTTEDVKRVANKYIDLERYTLAIVKSEGSS
ncbi:MAG: insulinase family protein [Deltaproteobacteria bacterium]|nr:insulinase family protein [Deltaproteobacteria bacterium]